MSRSSTSAHPGRAAGRRTLARALRETGLLLVVVLAATAGSWVIRGDRLPLRADPAYYELELAAPLVQPAAALALYEAGDHLFVDTRPDAPATVPGAFRVRERTFDDDLLANFEFLRPEDPLVVFGDGSLAAASNVAGRLRDRGFVDVVIMAGGLEAWRRQGGPVSERTDGR